VAILIGTSVLFGAIGLTGFYLGANEAFMFQLFVALFALYFIFSERIKAS
jgi:hypothetical protein